MFIIALLWRLFLKVLLPPFLALLFLLPLTATGTVVLRMDLEEMTSVSTVVVHARVVSSEVIQDPNRPITTRTTIEAIRVLKGESQFSKGRLWFDLLGGDRNGMHIRVPGTPTFRAGEEVILFLEANDTDYALCGLQQGVFRVTQTRQGTGVSRDLSGAAYAQFGRKGHYEMLHKAPTGVSDFPIMNLLNEVQFLLQENEGGSR